jgi:hypothetical protein
MPPQATTLVVVVVVVVVVTSPVPLPVLRRQYQQLSLRLLLRFFTPLLAQVSLRSATQHSSSSSSSNSGSSSRMQQQPRARVRSRLSTLFLLSRGR